MYVYWTLCICVLFLRTKLLLSEIVGENSKHTPHHINGHHNLEFDHEAILGSQDLSDDFSKLSAHEAKQRLAILVQRMDTNSDKFISRKELADRVLSNFQKQDDIETQQKFPEADTNGDGRITWSEYVLKVFGYTNDELQAFSKSTDPAMQSFLKMVVDEESKFNIADLDKNRELDVNEYSAFLHPHNYRYMHDLEISRTLADYDKDSDDRISFAEYVGESKPGRERLIVDRENFNSYDSNSDGYLDRPELLAWVLPDRESVADEEAEHLISETDANHDGLLSAEEILDRHDLWVGSAATDYGQELSHDPAEL